MRTDGREAERRTRVVVCPWGSPASNRQFRTSETCSTHAVIRNRSNSLKTKGRHPHYSARNLGLSIRRSSPTGPQYPLPRSSPPSSNRQSRRLEIRGGIRKKGVGASPNRQTSCHSFRSPTDLAIPGLAYCGSRFSSFKFRLSRPGCLSIVSSRIAAKTHTISSLGSSAHHNSKAVAP